MDRTERTELTVLCLLSDGENILLQDRTKQDWRGYALPGGHVEPGESIVAAVLREMQEETGLKIECPQLCGVKQFPIEGGRYLVFLFKTDRYSGTLKDSAEGKMHWVHRKQLCEYPTVGDLELLLSVMERDDLTEFQYTLSDGQWSAEVH